MLPLRRDFKMRVFHHDRSTPLAQNVPPTRREFLRGITSLGVLALLSYFVPSCSPTDEPASVGARLGEGGELPEPRKDGNVSVEETLLTRRSIRTYSGEALTLEDVSQLLWAAQGITSPKGFRTAPSAAATYTLETYLVVGDVDNLVEGVYRYQPTGHKLVKVLDGDYRPQLTSESVGRYFIEGGAIYILFTGVYSRIGTTAGGEGAKYVHMEVGHTAQNVYLQAVALGLGTVVNGGISSDQIREILEIPENEQPLYFMPVGRL
jgi:SagB-type dehydrogenase family enzyme